MDENKSSGSNKLSPLAPVICLFVHLFVLLPLFGGKGGIVTDAEGNLRQSLLAGLFGKSKTRSSEFRQPVEFGRTSFRPAKQTYQIVLILLGHLGTDLCLFTRERQGGGL